MSRVERILAGLIVLAGLLVVGALGARWYGTHQYQAGRTAAIEERAAADARAVLLRTQENAVLAQRQGETNLKITEAKHEELAPVRERIVVERVRVGAAICGPAAAPDAESSAGGDSADPPGRLVREDAERDLVALKLAVEEDLATGRACQAFLRENGLVP
ncbi:hypothetical protein QPK31_23160 [Massilia sp. YIM B02769]|uniref:hypothetical protein n=1 Tax=Massilia sp. YIM B02769 TaxID=3050129 RepID=UPI0025B64FC6|nr:hypothetical protein [Massilia sp. YIM B02769]MDN4061122.1 hypothetical protein [Massilia sp. YIM B02769]